MSYLESLLKEIVEFYNYDMKINSDGSRVIYDVDDTYEYNSVEEALIDWKETLVETDKCCEDEKVEKVWEKEIEFIETLQNKNKNS